MRIVVTGATGHVGSAMVRRLVADGHDVVGLARRVDDIVPGGDGVASSYRSVDLTRPESETALVDVFAGADAVVHLAWGFQPSHDQAYLEALGVGGTRRVLAAVAAAAVPHLVHQSSLGVYAPKRDDAPVGESYPTDGVPTSIYSRHKVAAERLLDEHERRQPGTTLITRLRPGIIGQRNAGSSLLRYGLPGLVPARALGLVPVLPMDRGLRVPMVHADDVADALSRVLDRRAGGAFNLVADPPVTAADIAAALGARLVHVPSGVLRGLVSASWHARLQQVDTGWIDLAFALPLLDATRARTELGWTPTHDAHEVLGEVLAGMREARSGPTPVLRPRSVRQALADAWRGGLVSSRHRP
ncbi:NAD-dependent epimerase/dehydratase family protein [Nocardioides massiliensis]|uniref:Nucleoside-diphosphate-sugar epimerase n=1 Tax=Nocardioides massiliensis TaxID=1325935 RepID=A0ABT9NIH1_9ACTN|nr:NAD-dependent epimerase/dehydratase family protein [Nocardioides massiliensis]MDP9820211.1 nucleoside-diphosphate-sugar epimerase [Nocardioides massiliensis]